MMYKTRHFPEVNDGPVHLPQDAHEPLIALKQSQRCKQLSNYPRCELKPSMVSALICATVMSRWFLSPTAVGSNAVAFHPSQVRPEGWRWSIDHTGRFIILLFNKSEKNWPCVTAVLQDLFIPAVHENLELWYCIGRRVNQCECE